MTTYSTTEVRCGNCDTVFQLETLLSSNRFGCDDLDLRPSEMLRHTLHTNVQSCPKCGLCAASIDSVSRQAIGELVASKYYQDSLNDEKLPLLVRRMWALRLVEIQMGRFDRAGWAALWAAWSCDDAELTTLAGLLRLAAAETFEEAVNAGQQICHDAPSTQALLADLFRRAGRFDRAVLATESIVSAKDMPGMTDLLQDILEFQAARARAFDTSRYTTDDAEQASPRWAYREAIRIDRAGRRYERQKLLRQEVVAKTAPKSLPAALRKLILDSKSIYYVPPTDTLAAFEQLPIPFFLAMVMQANVRAYAWPFPATLTSMCIALTRIHPEIETDCEDLKTHLQKIGANHCKLADYLTYCFRGATLSAWHYAPPQVSVLNIEAPIYRD